MMLIDDLDENDFPCQFEVRMRMEDRAYDVINCGINGRIDNKLEDVSFGFSVLKNEMHRELWGFGIRR